MDPFLFNSSMYVRMLTMLKVGGVPAKNSVSKLMLSKSRSEGSPNGVMPAIKGN